jgi:hypothetical protein
MKLSGVSTIPSASNVASVVFPFPVSGQWNLDVCVILNTIDPTPLNLIPGAITQSTNRGFSILLSGATDSPNYQLSWSAYFS